MKESKVLTKTKVIFLCLYCLHVVAIYYTAYTEFNFSFELLRMKWLFGNLWIMSPYVVGVGLVVFLGFSNIKRRLVNLASIILCSVLPFNVLFYGAPDAGGTGLEGTVFFVFSILQLCFLLIFTAVIYFIGFVVTIWVGVKLNRF